MNSLGSMSQDARREWQRVANELLIDCQQKGRQGSATYFTRNISGGGLMFEAPEVMTPGTQLEIEIRVPIDHAARRERCLCLSGQVRWTSMIPDAFECEGSNRYRIGITFHQISPIDQACLEEHVRKRLELVG